MKNKPVMLLILDGWGEAPPGEENAVFLAKTPVWDDLMKTAPHTVLGASGEAVGLPGGQMGNSEVGHLNIGAGRVVYQQFTRIDRSIAQKDFFENPVFLNIMSSVKKKNGALHLMGLVSDGGVHSHIRHIYALCELAKANGLDKVFIHAILDGRDTPPRSADKFISDLENRIREIGTGKIATVSGRYYAMDRDKRWERTLLAYKAYTEGQGLNARSAMEAVQFAYERNENDEFVQPTVLLKDGQPVGTLQDGDGVIFFNFRPDRARQITDALMSEKFTGFQRKVKPHISFVCMSQFDKNFGLPIAYPPQDLKNIFGEIISEQGLRQLRIAETEKYAHVTFFFNGQIEQPFRNEDRILVPSPKVATYDLQPEMSAYPVTAKAVEAIKSDKYDVIILNYANGDMVGHTGIMDAAIKAVETVDTCLGEIVQAIREKGGELLVTADHGNAEKMKEPGTGKPFTAHTTGPVPLIYIGPRKVKFRKNGILADLAPTMLEFLEIPKPDEMEGKGLLNI